MLKIENPNRLHVPPSLIAYAMTLETDLQQRLRARMGVSTIHLYYWRPDRPLVLQEYIQQLDDDLDFLPRSLKFINFWQHNLDGKLHEIELDTHGKHVGYRAAALISQLN